MKKPARRKSTEDQYQSTRPERPCLPMMRYWSEKECSVAGYNSVTTSEIPRNMAIPRHHVTICARVSIASSAILSFVYFLIARKASIIIAGPAAKAVEMNLIGIIEWNHIGLDGM